MLAKPRVIMFDWGGTLVQTHREHEALAPCARSAVAALTTAGAALAGAAADNLHAAFLENWQACNTLACQAEFDTPAFLHRWAEQAGVRLPDPLDGVIDAFWRPWVGCLHPFAGAVETLRTLKSAGIALGLVSNCATTPHVCLLEITRQEIAPLLTFSLFSSELGVRKPHPRIYATALARAAQALNGSDGPHQPLTPAAVLFVGDTPTADVAGPAQAGMKTALVRTGNWRGDRAALPHPPDLILDSVDDLRTLWN